MFKRMISPVLWTVVGIAFTAMPLWGLRSSVLPVIYGVLGWAMYLITEYFYEVTTRGWIDSLDAWKQSNEVWKEYTEQQADTWRKHANDPEQAEGVLTELGYTVIAPPEQFDGPAAYDPADA